MSLVRGSPSPVNGVRQFLLMHVAQKFLIDWDTSSLRGSWVRIPPPASICIMNECKGRFIVILLHVANSICGAIVGIYYRLSAYKN